MDTLEAHHRRKALGGDSSDFGPRIGSRKGAGKEDPHQNTRFLSSLTVLKIGIGQSGPKSSAIPHGRMAGLNVQAINLKDMTVGGKHSEEQNINQGAIDLEASHSHVIFLP